VGERARVGATPAEGDDPRWADSEPRLVELIRDEILAAPERRITFARFMERALAEPGLGYYATSEARPTRAGDYLTAPELHPLFGRCLARYIERAWRRLGQPARFEVREYGAGRGALAASVRNGLEADGSVLADGLAWQPVDLPGRWAEAPRGPVTGLVLANEFLDALPVHRIGWSGGRLVEYHVTWRHGWFHEVAAAPSTPALAERLADDGVGLREGQRAEVSLAADIWLTEVARSIERGWVLVIDYGHEAGRLFGADRMRGSLVTYRGHRAGEDPFVAVGRQDITAHVDLTALRRLASGVGLGDPRLTSQARFLLDLGLGDLLSELGRSEGADPDAYLEARASVGRLLDPRHLGGFRVLEWCRGTEPLIDETGPVSALGADA
jgi:SAM-dependent MidA family methyltransferase